jgi:OOP family OmpA-OmpF porin
VRRRGIGPGGRRTAAVRQALSDRYRVAPARLTSQGFGASRPKDTNDTLEGRARNRRVELVREGGVP